MTPSLPEVQAQGSSAPPTALPHETDTSCSRLLDLHIDVLLAVLHEITDPECLAAVCCTCPRLRAVGATPTLWRALSTRRWSNTNAALFSLPLPVQQAAVQPATPCKASASLSTDAVGEASGSGVINPSCDADSGRGGAPPAPPTASGHSQPPCPVPDGGRGGNASTSAPARGTDWKALWADGNAWSAPRFHIQLVEPKDDFVSASYALAGARHDVLYLGTGSSLQAWRLPNTPTYHHTPTTTAEGAADDDGGTSTGGSWSYNAPDLLTSCAIPSPHVLYALTSLGGGQLVAGNNFGGLAFYHHDPDAADGGGGSDGGALTFVASTGAQSQPEARAPAVDLQLVCGTSLLVALHDATFVVEGGGVRQRNLLRMYDIQAQAELGTVADILDSYELVSFCSMASSGSPQELLAGSVYGDYCNTCFEAGIPSLCVHKASAHRSALCTFDLRTPRVMTNRYNLTQRSLYPCIRSARGIYLFTSSASQPLTVWDRRFMSTPLYVEDSMHYLRRPTGRTQQPAPSAAVAHLGGSGAGDSSGGELLGSPAGAAGPSLGASQDEVARSASRRPTLDVPKRNLEHQGLWLDCSEDVLVGRSENGMLWRWDLSATLGWQASGAAASGSWKVLEADGGSGQWWHWDWPAPLGALACESSLASVQLLGGADPQVLVCPSCEAVDGVEYVACLRLAPAVADGEGAA